MIKPIPPRPEPSAEAIASAMQEFFWGADAPRDVLVLRDQDGATVLVAGVGPRAIRRAITGRAHQGRRFVGVLNPSAPLPSGVAAYQWRGPGVFGPQSILPVAA